MILFEFAESGFFSIYDNFNAALLCMWAFIVKIIMGLIWIKIANSDQYSRSKAMFQIKRNAYDNDNDNNNQYEMAPLRDEQDLEKGDNI